MSLLHLNEGLFSRSWVAKWVSFENRLVEFPRLLANNLRHFVRVEKPEFLLLRLENIHSTVFVTWQGVPGHHDPCSWQGSVAMNLVTLRGQMPQGSLPAHLWVGGCGRLGLGEEVAFVLRFPESQMTLDVKYD